MESGIEKLFSLLSASSSFLRNRSALQIGELAAENLQNVPVFLYKIYKDIVSNPCTSWDSRYIMYVNNII